ncbi:MAG: response regulator [Rhodopila sp.]|jgi:two-component system chemotaxis response regulator CheY
MTAGTVPSSAGSHRILVVDDATTVRLYYRQTLEAAGFEVEEALNGVEGLEKILAGRFDLALVDVNMPQMDGFSLLHALRRTPEVGGLPAMITSTEAAASDRDAARDAGANFYLVKPVQPEDLLLHVRLLTGAAA